MYNCFCSRMQNDLAAACWLMKEEMAEALLVLQVLKLLAGDFLRQHPVFQQRIIVLLLDHVIILPAQRKLSIAALKALKKQDVPELSGMCRLCNKKMHFSPVLLRRESSLRKFWGPIMCGLQCTKAIL